MKEVMLYIVATLFIVTVAKLLQWLFSMIDEDMYDRRIHRLNKMKEQEEKEEKL